VSILFGANSTTFDAMNEAGISARTLSTQWNSVRRQRRWRRITAHALPNRC
jgi:hypothetical protein